MARGIRVRISSEVKRTIQKAQRRLRNAPSIMKKIANAEGLSKPSLKGSVNDVTLSYRKAKRINEIAEFTKRGYRKFVRTLASDTRLSEKTVEFALSQIDERTYNYVSNSKLRYGSNPQLDYIADNVVEIKDRLLQAVSEMESFLADDFEGNLEVF